MRGGILGSVLALAAMASGVLGSHAASAAGQTGGSSATSARSSAVLATWTVPWSDRLMGIGVDTAVTSYADCSGRSAVPQGMAAIDRCAPAGLVYFLGHNPGVFSPLMSAKVGQTITWIDGAGLAHPLKIISVRNVSRFDGFPAPTAGALVEFQTCANADGSVDRILDAGPA